jgi:hypothetical protein
MNFRPSLRVTANASCANFNDKPAKTPQLYSVAASHGSNDFIQNGVDNLLNVTVVEVGILRCNSQYKL